MFFSIFLFSRRVVGSVPGPGGFSQQWRVRCRTAFMSGRRRILAWHHSSAGVAVLCILLEIFPVGSQTLFMINGVLDEIG